MSTPRHHHPSHKGSRAFAGLVPFILAGASTGTAPADTHIVDITGKGDFRHVQDAIDASSPGDLVLVRPGAYRPKWFDAAVATVPTDLSGLTIRSTHGAASTILQAARSSPPPSNRRGAMSSSRGVVWKAPGGRLEGFTIENGSATNGAGLYATCLDLSVEACTFRFNRASRYGGAAYLNASRTERSLRPRITECRFEANDAGTDGGSVYANGGLQLDGCEFMDSRAENRGGGVFVQNDRFGSELSDVWAGGCSARLGGFLAARGSVLSMRGGDAVLNAASQGGAMYVDGESRLEIEDWFFESNEASHFGGAISLEFASADLDGVGFRENRSDIGGAMDAWNASIRSLECDWHSNRADTEGGAVALDLSEMDGRRDRFDDNDSDAGGAIWSDRARLALTHAAFTGNAATYMGGALSLKRSTASVEESRFEGNGSENGGAFHLAGTDVHCMNTDFENHDAVVGGAIHGDDNVAGRLRLSDCTFDSNEAWGNGGAISSVNNVEAVGCRFTSNVTEVAGGHVRLVGDGSGSSFLECVFEDGTLSHASYTASAGGALYAVGLRGDLVFSECTAVQNDSGTQGGAFRIEASGGGRLAIEGCDFRLNRDVADAGGFFGGEGGQLHVSGNRLTVTDSVLEGRSQLGGAIYGLVHIDRSTVLGLASGAAGAAYLVGRCDVRDSVLSGGTDGAIAAVVGGDLRNTTVVGRRAENFLGSPGYDPAGRISSAGIDSAIDCWFGFPPPDVVFIRGVDSGNVKDGRSCILDFDHDGDIDAADLGRVSAKVGSTGWGQREDLDRDGDVDADDVDIIRASVGTSC